MFERQNVISSIEKACEDYGYDWVDPNAGSGRILVTGCTNTYIDADGNQRHCIAAYVLFDLTDADPKDVPDVGIIELVCDEFDGQFTKEAGNLLMAAQVLQDSGAPWGSIYTAAKNSVI